jgi:hypothetical protein
MMNPLKRSAIHMALPARPTPQDRSITKRRYATAAVGLTLPAVVVGIVLWMPFNAPVLAKTGAQADTKDAPAIEPGAMDALNKMGSYLRTLNSFQVKADITDDDVIEDGQTIQSSTKVDLIAARPNRMRLEVTGDDEHRFFFFDGKNFTIYGQLVNYYATVPAPPTIAKLTDDLSNKYGIELPLVDLFQWGTNDSTIAKIKSAMDVGPATVDGVTCEQYAFRQENIDWQLWIQLGEFPLPRKLIIRTLNDDAKPQHSEILTWNLAPSFSEDAFTYVPSSDARRITIAEVKATAAENNK